MSRMHDRLAVLSQPVRTRLLRLLELEELGVGEVARVLQLPQSTVSRHLKELREAGWVTSRKEGTANLFALSLELDEASEALWDLVRGATDGEHPDDALRLTSVLAARSAEGSSFFGRLGSQWSELRRDLFGEGYLLPALVALLPPELVVADLGCGTGEVLEHVAHAAKRVIGIDREPAMLRAAAERTEGLANVELRQGLIGDPPLEPGEVDVALCMLALHHVAEPSEVFAGCGRALRPGGHVVVIDMVAHRRTAYRRTMGHLHLGFDEAALSSAAAAGGMRLTSHRFLSPAPDATGPALFLATAVCW